MSNWQALEVDRVTAARLAAIYSNDVKMLRFNIAMWQLVERPAVLLVQSIFNPWIVILRCVTEILPTVFDQSNNQ